MLYAGLLAGRPPASPPQTVPLPLIKVLYFLNGWSGASFGRFATLFYVAKHLSSKQIGYIEAAQPLARAVGNQIAGWMADSLQRKKVIALLARCITTALLESFLFKSIGCTGCFYPILATMMVMAFFSVGGGLLDSYTLDALGEERQREYGKYRLWLAISWGVGNAVMGLVAEANFDNNFITFGVMNGLSILLMAMLLPARTRDEIARVRERSAAAENAGTGEANIAPGATAVPQATLNRDSSFCEALCRWQVVVFLAEMTYFGVAASVVEKFLFIYLTNELNAPYSLCGYSVAMTVLFEIPIFHYASPLLRTWL